MVSSRQFLFRCIEGGLGSRLPQRGGVGIADAPRDGADAHVAVVDPPGFLVGFGIAAAGELGHAPLKRGEVGIGKPQQIAG